MNFLDAKKKHIYPGLTDGHGHIISLAEMMLSVNLFGCPSMADLLTTTKTYQDKNKRTFIVGRGWDQSLWGTDALPTNIELNEAFPDTPVCLFRVDGHAAIANQAALDRAGITIDSKIDGGVFQKSNGKLTGLLVDNAMELMNDVIPDFSEEEMLATFNKIQQELFEYGITSIHEAGINNDKLPLFKAWNKSGKMDLQIYGMLTHSEENMELAKKGHFSIGSLDVEALKCTRMALWDLEELY